MVFRPRIAGESERQRLSVQWRIRVEVNLKSMSRQYTSSAGIFCWLLLAASGVLALWRYELTAGVELGVPHRWPEDSALSPPSCDSSVLLMFVHPRCGCTTAGLIELKALMNRTNFHQLPKVTFVLLQPQKADAEWIGSNNESLCRQFNNEQIFYDSNSEETARFGVATSGMCLLYSAEGNLVFSGGITASRGHHGPSLGQEYLQSAMESDRSTYRDFPAFGCSLTTQTRQTRQIAINR